MLRSVLPYTLAACLAACGGPAEEGGTNEVLEGSVVVRPLNGTWVPAEAGPVAFATQTAIEAGVKGATLDASIGGKARAKLELGPGARISRRNANAIDLLVGTVTVSTTGLTDRVLVYHAGCYAEAGRAAPGDAVFSATSAGPHLAVLSAEGTVQLNAPGETPMELNYAMLGPGEQGVAVKGAKPEKRHIDDSKAGPYLTPRISFTAEAGAAGDPLLLAVTIEAGESGAFLGLPVASDSDSLVLLAEGSEERTIALRAAHVRKGATLPDSVLARGDVPFALPFDVTDHGLAAGVWKLRLRYRSYREHAEGPEWIGWVESEPVTVNLR